MTKRLTKRDGEHTEDSLAYEVTTPVNLGQLDAEIVAEMGWRKAAGLVVEGLVENATEEEPVVLWVTHGGAKASTVTSVIKDHEPDSSWRPESSDASREGLISKLESGGSLDSDEVRQALLILLKH